MEQAYTHHLLKEQLEQVFGSGYNFNSDLQAFIELVNRSYYDFERSNADEKLKSYAENLEKKNKELDQFAYIVSHDLKAPLRGITNISNWIEEDLKDKDLDEDIKTNLHLLRKRVSRMEALINGILQYSRAGRIKNEVSEVNTHDLVMEIINSIAPSSSITFQVADDLPVITTEKIALEQVLTNYISNAAKYNNHGAPRVSISSRKNDNMYEFCVEDNGPGIDPQYFEKIFQVFQTLQPRDVSESTGVGLAIVKKIVEDKGGKAWLESEPGKGTKFYFSWPE